MINYFSYLLTKLNLKRLLVLACSCFVFHITVKHESLFLTYYIIIYDL